MRFFDLFSGIGGFREGLRRAEGFTCVGHCEADVHAERNYRILFDTEGEWFCDDAGKIETGRMPDFDLLCAGFPCQAFSVAGKRLGFEDARGTLFFEISRLAAEKRPSYLLLENVPGLLSHDGGRTFQTILSTLSELGYHVEWKVLNSKDFGVPQSRRRVYIIGYLDGRCAGKILPFPNTNRTSLIQVSPGHQGGRVYHPDGIACTLTSNTGGMGGKTGLYEVGTAGRGQRRGTKSTLHFVDLSAPPVVTEYARCLLAKQDNGVGKRKGEKSGVLKETGPRAVLSPDKKNPRQNGRQIKRPEEPMFTITATDRHGVVYKGRVRRLTPRECLRLQGYYDYQITLLLENTSDSQIYRQAGNGVTVPVVEAIGRHLSEVDTLLKDDI